MDFGGHPLSSQVSVWRCTAQVSPLLPFHHLFVKTEREKRADRARSERVKEEQITQTKHRSSSHKADFDQRCCTKAQSVLPRSNPSHWEYRKPCRHGESLHKGDLKHKGDAVDPMCSGEDVLLRDPMHGEDPVNTGGQHSHRGRKSTRCPMHTGAQWTLFISGTPHTLGAVGGG